MVSPVEAAPKVISTPSRFLPSPSALRTNVALPAPAGIGVPPRAILSRVTVDFLSSTWIVVSLILRELPFVVDSTLATLPFAIVKLNFVTTVYPSGAAVSSRLYVPFLRPVNVMLLPVNS